MNQTLISVHQLSNPEAAGREFGGRLELVTTLVDQLQPYQPLPEEVRLHCRQKQIARDGESAAAWDAHLLSIRLEQVKELAAREGLLGLAVAVERAIRLLDEATSLYAFAGRDDDKVIEAQIKAATGREGARLGLLLPGGSW